MVARKRNTPIERIDVSAYRIPTDYQEADGTYAWASTTLVLVEAMAGGERGIGYTYADVATAELARSMLASIAAGRDAMSIPETWQAMTHAVRNLGRPGVSSMAIAAVDIALWDLKCRILGLPLVTLLGAARESVPVYGSGGFTSYPIKRLQEQLGGWAREGITRVKMKIGAHPEDDRASTPLGKRSVQALTCSSTPMARIVASRRSDKLKRSNSTASSGLRSPSHQTIWKGCVSHATARQQE